MRKQTRDTSLHFATLGKGSIREATWKLRQTHQHFQRLPQVWRHETHFLGGITVPHGATLGYSSASFLTTLHTPHIPTYSPHTIITAIQNISASLPLPEHALSCFSAWTHPIFVPHFLLPIAIAYLLLILGVSLKVTCCIKCLSITSTLIRLCSPAMLPHILLCFLRPHCNSWFTFYPHHPTITWLKWRLLAHSLW